MSEKKYFPAIGLEIHAELKTRTKMFCDSKNDPDEARPNVNICPVCMGHPGTLPVINKEAVKHVIKLGIAVGGRIADFSEFDRKNYFYPDIPKGYQISQYKYPLVSGGIVRGVAITRVHLEEDTASSLHEAGEGSLIDFNRAGVPLMELVTEPVIKSGEEASAFAEELQLILRYLGIAEANMEKGEMRVEANISVSAEEGKLGTKVEVKNLNSFRAVERAIAFEIERHKALLEKGEKVIQETRGWDENTGKTFSQRAKEESHDYRYFPDPDLPKLKISEIPEFSDEAIRKELPELPSEKRFRYKDAYGLKETDIEIYVKERTLGAFFEDVSGLLGADKAAIAAASNYITSDLIGLLKAEGASLSDPLRFAAEDFKDLIMMVRESKISSRGAKDILAIMFAQGGHPQRIADEKGLLQQSDEGAIQKVVEAVIAENQKVAEEYKGGKEASLQFLIGQGMKKTKGAANPEILKRIFKERLTK